MARKKTNLQYIANDAIRRSTFKKRRRGMIKKVSELSILCGVDACAVVYGQGETSATIWPDEDGTKKTIQCLQALPKYEQCKKMMNQEGFISQSVTKQMDQLRRNWTENEKLKMHALMMQGLEGRSFHDLGINETSALTNYVETMTNEVRAHMEAMKAQMAAAAEEGATKGKAPMDAATIEAMAMQTNWCNEIPVPSYNEWLIYGGSNASTTNGMNMMMQPYLDEWNDPFFPI